MKYKPFTAAEIRRVVTRDLGEVVVDRMADDIVTVSLPEFMIDGAVRKPVEVLASSEKDGLAALFNTLTEWPYPENAIVKVTRANRHFPAYRFDARKRAFIPVEWHKHLKKRASRRSIGGRFMRAAQQTQVGRTVKRVARTLGFKL